MNGNRLDNFFKRLTRNSQDNIKRIDITIPSQDEYMDMERMEKDKIPFLNIVLLLATVFTTLVAGALIENAPLFMDQAVQNVLSSFPTDTTERKLSILDKVFEIVAPLQNNLFAHEKIMETAQLLGLKSGASEIIGIYKDHLKEGHKTPKTPKKEDATDINQNTKGKASQKSKKGKK